MIHATKILSEFAYKLKYEDLPSEVTQTTKKYIADYYAAAFAGIKVNRQFNDAVGEVILDMGGKAECDFIFSSERIPAPNAAFMSACYAHGADMDDGNRKAMGHVGAHVISAVLTLAQTLPVSGKDIITAINVGYEVYNRVAAAVQPGLVHRGFHSTGTAGAIACGAASAKLMGMDEEGIYNTMALSAIQASGLIIIAESGQCCKPINPANAAKTGIGRHLNREKSPFFFNFRRMLNLLSVPFCQYVCIRRRCSISCSSVWKNTEAFSKSSGLSRFI